MNLEPKGAKGASSLRLFWEKICHAISDEKWELWNDSLYYTKDCYTKLAVFYFHFQAFLWMLLLLSNIEGRTIGYLLILYFQLLSSTR